MAAFDAQQAGLQQQGDVQHGDVQHEQSRLSYLEGHVHYSVNQIQHLQSVQATPIPLPHSPSHPNLNLPTPPYFSGTPSELPLFKLKLVHFLVGNQSTYHNSEKQLLYAGSLLQGSAVQWYHSLVDPGSTLLPPHYDLPLFFQELEDFFGGAVTLQSRERSLTLLRQTGSVSELAVAFQTITHTTTPSFMFSPRNLRRLFASS